MNMVSNGQSTAMKRNCAARWTRMAGLVNPGPHNPHCLAGTHAYKISVVQRNKDVMLHDVLHAPSSNASSFAMLCTLVITQICTLDLLHLMSSWKSCSCECKLQQTHMSNGLSPMHDVHLPSANNVAPGAQRVLNIITSRQFGLNAMVHGKQLLVDAGYYR